jgi:hypothetical protein
LKPASVKTIIASLSLRNRHPPGFTVLSAVDSCRRMMGIRADRSSNGGCAVFNKPGRALGDLARLATARREACVRGRARTFLQLAGSSIMLVPDRAVRAPAPGAVIIGWISRQAARARAMGDELAVKPGGLHARQVASVKVWI